MPDRPPKKSKAERDLDTACGGRRVLALRNNAPAERVFVRQLPLRFAETYVELMLAGKEQERIELCLGKSAHWDNKYKGKHAADIYTIAGQIALLAVADELNFPIALGQIERRKNTIGSLEGMLKRLYAFQASMMQEAMEKMVKHLVGSVLSSLPASPSSAAPTPRSGATGASTSSPSPSTSTPPPGASAPSGISTPPTTPPPAPLVSKVPPPPPANTATAFDAPPMSVTMKPPPASTP
ncbi:hypothetical protein OH491_13525 [Termitidicoccus mucosus]|uniref:hypothetical protein n=1 Tax=Termitidicoccus mucosus TaxID=1184151 RepID=UPI0011AB48C6